MKFNQIWFVSCSHEWGEQRKKNFGPAPWGNGGGSKGQISLNFNHKVNCKDFYSKLCVCVLTNERYKTYQSFFFILSPGSCPRGVTWGYLGAKIKLRPAVCPLCYLLLNHLTKLNQIWCVSYSHEWCTQHQFFGGHAPWGPGEGLKGQISFNFNYKVNFKDFYSRLCVCSHK